MMQTADFGPFNDCPVGTGLYSSCFWGVFAQREMGAPLMVIADIGRKRVTQRAFTEHNDVVQTLAANRADEPLHIRPLPRGSGRREYLFDSHGLHLLDELLTEDSIAVAQQITRRTLPGKSIAKLLGRPLRRRMSGDAHLENTAAVMR